MALLEAHFDESIGETPRRILCIAGYLMTERSARRLAREWRGVLQEYELPYFRMSACAHGNHPFGHLSKHERVAVQTKLIEITKRRTMRGFATIVDLDEFDQYMLQHPLIGSAYTFSAHVIIGGIASWVAESGYDGRIAYMFEAGHRSQGEAEGIMKKIFNDPQLKSGQRYASHAFVDKASSPPTQAADLLSWHAYTDFRHQLEGKPRRKDFASLLRPTKDWAVRIDQSKLVELSIKWARGDASLARLHLGEKRP
jgi:hypothetical protein